MKAKRKLKGLLGVVLAAAVAVLALPAFATAHEGEYAQFDFCPSTTEGVQKCLYSVTEGGEVVLGKKTVPIVNPVPLQGGLSKPDQTTRLSTFFEATNGVTLAKVPQPVPGGLAGLVNCNEIGDAILRALCEWTFENGFTGANSTLELAKPATEIRVSEFHLVTEEGLALELPVKVHLENPLLGSECYIGSSSTPLIWKLTTGETSPPAPNTPIHGAGGEAEFLDEGRILELKNSELVDNAWSAPGANGCGGPLFEAALDPIINAAVGVPAAAGKNAAILEVTSSVASAKAVNEH